MYLRAKEENKTNVVVRYSEVVWLQLLQMSQETFGTEAVEKKAEVFDDILFHHRPYVSWHNVTRHQLFWSRRSFLLTYAQSG